MADDRIKKRIAWLKKNRPGDPDIKKLQQKLSVGETGGGATTTAPTIQETIQDAGTIMDAAMGKGQALADQYIPEGTFGTMQEGSSPEMLALLQNLRQWAEQAGQYTGYETQALDALKAGLGGYLAPELQAMREQRLMELDNEVATQMRQQQLMAARSRMRAPMAAAAANNIQRQAVQTRGNMEQDLFARNADVIQQRKEAFGKMVNAVETARFGRKNQADTLYADNLGAEEAVQRGIKTFNIGQKQNQALAKGGLALSGAGTFTGLFGGQQSNDLAQGYFDFAKQQGDWQHDYLMKQLALQRKQLAADIASTGQGGPQVTNNYNYGAGGTQ